jgi:polyphosphate kinase
VDLRHDLRRPELYVNRELSLLEFNARVLAQAADRAVPLLERLRFLCITSTNLDEFFEIRVAGLLERLEAGTGSVEPDGIGPPELLRAIAARTHALVAEQYRLLNDDLVPALGAAGILLLAQEQWTAEQRDWLRGYFEDALAPVLSPLALDPAHPFPRILNKSLNLAVMLSGHDAFGREAELAIVQAPRALPRVIALPAALSSTPSAFVLLSTVIHAFLGELFPGMQVHGGYPFRVTRNSELYVDEEEAEDLKRAIEGELPSRRYGDAVRLEVAHNCPQELAEYLRSRFLLPEQAVYRVDGPVNLNRLVAICEEVERPDLKYPPFLPSLPRALAGETDLYLTIARQDVLLHHPFESFVPVVEFVQRAATDPQVLAIKQTLYRTGPDSVIVDALVAAARAGKEVTVVIELRARFDEEANIALANRLEEAGAHVTYGVVGYKTHAKLTLVVRRESGALRHYAHIGTGNYHPRTARLYTDYGLLSCDPELGADMRALFLQLTSPGVVQRFGRLLESPFTLAEGILERIERETRHAQAGRHARIVLKLNALVEARVIQALYAAAQAGVQVDLIVRGMCALRPGVPGVSDGARVRSIVGRFLEHTRVYYFENHGAPELYCASADFMERNFYRRVEVAFPIRDAALRRRVLDEIELYLADNTQAWDMQPDGTYVRATPDGHEPLSAQAVLLARYGEG